MLLHLLLNRARACVRFTRSEMVKMAKEHSRKNQAANRSNRLGEQVNDGGGAQDKADGGQSDGDFSPAIRMFGGTFQPRSPLYLKRSTSIEVLLKTKLHITPNAYASPSTYTSPRLTRMMNNCSTTTMLMMR